MTEIAASTLLLLSCASFVAGFVDSIAGGGGLITIPSLLLAGIPPQFALGTNKLSSALGTATAVFNFARKRLVWWPFVAFGIGFALLGGLLGSRTILAVDPHIANIIIACLLPLAATTLLWNRREGPGHRAQHRLRPLALKASAICFAVGFYDGFFGPGAGTLFALGFFAFLQMDLLQASANARVFNLVSNLASLAIFLVHQKVIFEIAIPMAIANMMGNFLGSHIAIKKGNAFIRKILFGVLLLLFASVTVRIFWERLL